MSYKDTLCSVCGRQVTIGLKHLTCLRKPVTRRTTKLHEGYNNKNVYTRSAQRTAYNSQSWKARLASLFN